MGIQTIDATVSSAAPPAAVFALLQDVTTWATWGDWKTSEYEREGSPAPHGIGAIRRFTGRATSREEVVALEQDAHLGYVLLSGLPIKDYRADVRLTPGTDGGTTISWRSTFRGKAPLAGIVIRLALQRFISDTADRLARAAEVQHRAG